MKEKEPPPEVDDARDTGEQERLLPTARWLTEEQLRQRHFTPIPLAEEVCLGPIRPVLNEETIRATVAFASGQLEQIRRAKEDGDYQLASRLGENLWQALFRTQFDWPSYFFLAEVAARMCFLFDPLRDMEKIKPWQERLNYVLLQLRGQPIHDHAIYYHLVVILAISDFFSHAERYLHALAHPGERLPEKSWEFFSEEWRIYLTRLESMMSHRAPHLGSSAGDIAIQLGPRSDYLFSTIRHERLRMEAVSHADRYRWDPAYLMRDRDSAVATLPLNSFMQSEVKQAERMTMQYMHSFWTPREKLSSPLVLGAEVSSVRYALDQGKYLEAKRLSDTLLSRFAMQRRVREAVQLLVTRGQGFLIWAELLLRDGSPRFLQEAKALKGPNGNRETYADHIMNDGLADLLGAHQTIEQSRRPAASSQMARQCRSLILRGMVLKIAASHSLPRELQTLAPRLFEICVSDLALADRETRSFVFVPRLAEAWHAFTRTKMPNFMPPEKRHAPKEIFRYGRESLDDLVREALESDQGVDIPLDETGVPLTPSARYFDECFRQRKRPYVPQAYSDRVREKQRFVADFS